MAVTHSTSSKNDATDAVVDSVDTGAGGNGTLVLKASTTTVATFALPNPAFGAASSGQATLNSVSNVSATASGTVDSFDLLDADDNNVLSGTVTATSGGGDLEIDNTDVNSGQAVSLSSLTYSALSQ